jgi:hypothetical protein
MNECRAEGVCVDPCKTPTVERRFRRRESGPERRAMSAASYLQSDCEKRKKEGREAIATVTIVETFSLFKLRILFSSTVDTFKSCQQKG